MMPRHPFSHPTIYTNQLGTAAVVIAAAFYVLVFVSFLWAITPSFIHWS